MAALSVTHLNVPLVWEARSQQNGMAKFQVTVGRLALEGREYYPVGDALRKVTKIVKVLCLEGTQG